MKNAFCLLPALLISSGVLADVSLSDYEGHWQGAVPANYFIFVKNPILDGSASCNADFTIKVLGDAFQITGNKAGSLADCRVPVPAPSYSVFTVFQNGSVIDNSGKVVGEYGKSYLKLTFNESNAPYFTQGLTTTYFFAIDPQTHGMYFSVMNDRVGHPLQDGDIRLNVGGKVQH